MHFSTMMTLLRKKNIPPYSNRLTQLAVCSRPGKRISQNQSSSSLFFKARIYSMIQNWKMKSFLNELTATTRRANLTEMKIISSNNSNIWSVWTLKV